MNLTPIKGEKKNEFINRLLVDDQMKVDYPDVGARFAAIAYEWYKVTKAPPSKEGKV